MNANGTNHDFDCPPLSSLVVVHCDIDRIASCQFVDDILEVLLACYRQSLHPHDVLACHHPSHRRCACDPAGRRVVLELEHLHTFVRLLIHHL